MFFLPSARMGLEVPLQACPALKILYVLHRTITETPMVHCTLNGLIFRHKHVKNVLVQHLGRASWRPRPACLEAGQIQTIIPSAPEWCRGKGVRQGKAFHLSLAGL